MSDVYVRKNVDVVGGVTGARSTEVRYVPATTDDLIGVLVERGVLTWETEAKSYSLGTAPRLDPGDEPLVLTGRRRLVSSWQPAEGTTE